MKDITLIIPAKFESESLPIFFKEINHLNCKKIIILEENDYQTINSIKNFEGIKIAVSPIVNGEAIKGPAAKMLNELGEEVSCVGIAKLLHGICDVLIIDTQDSNKINNIKKLGINAVATNTIMNSDKDKIELAEFILDIIKNQP